MRTRHEAIENLEYLISGECCDSHMDYIEEIEMAIVDMKICEANNAGWISVKDRLPEHKAVCLTYSPKGKMRVAEAFIPSSIPNSTYDKMECWWSTHGDGGHHYVAVTHWMPLPEPPKEGRPPRRGVN